MLILEQIIITKFTISFLHFRHFPVPYNGGTIITAGKMVIIGQRKSDGVSRLTRGPLIDHDDNGHIALKH